MFSRRKVVGFSPLPSGTEQENPDYLKYNWNYDRTLGQVDDRIRNQIECILKTEYELEKDFTEIQAMSRASKLRNTRTVLGYCSANPHALIENCTCCKFGDPKATFYARVFGIIAKYFNSERYDGVSVYRLVSQEELGDLLIPPDISFYSEFTNPMFMWRDHVSRFFSRYHWIAVKCEALRLCGEWLKFMSAVNRSSTVFLSYGDSEKKLFEKLSPRIPPRPVFGDFLCSKDMASELRDALYHRVLLFSKNTYLHEFDLERTARFKLCDVVARFTLYAEDEDAKSYGVMNNAIDSMLFKREINRRVVNSIRELGSRDHSEFFSPVDLTLNEALLRPEGNSCYEWSITEQEKLLCSAILNQSNTTAYISYLPGTTDVSFFNTFSCDDCECTQLMEQLFIQRPCDEGCHIAVKVFPCLEIVDNTQIMDSSYAIAVSCEVVRLNELFARVENFIRNNCVAESFTFKYEPTELHRHQETCVVVYKFIYSDRYEF